MRPFSLLPILCFLGFSSCFTIPEFPLAPSISFNSVFFKDEPGLSDIIYLTLNYKDGDGDLGLNKEDFNVPPFTDLKDSSGNQITNPNQYNIFPMLFEKKGEIYTETVGFPGTFPRLRDPNFKKGPVEGTLLYKLTSSNFFGGVNSIVKIRVYIQDRNLNKSNVIETPPFPVVFN